MNNLSWGNFSYWT